MTSFEKTKIGFAVALLAALFAASPAIDRVANRGFEMLGLWVSLAFLHGAMTFMLAAAVYCYAAQFALDRRSSIGTHAGDLVYAAALVAPVGYLLLFTIATVAAWLVAHITVAVVIALAAIAPLAGLVVVAWATSKVERQISRAQKLARIRERESRERQHARQRLEALSSQLLEVARSAFPNDLERTVRYARASVGSAAKALALDQGIVLADDQWPQFIMEKRLLPEALQMDFGRFTTVDSRASTNAEVTLGYLHDAELILETLRPPEMRSDA